MHHEILLNSFVKLLRHHVFGEKYLGNVLVLLVSRTFCDTHRASENLAMELSVPIHEIVLNMKDVIGYQTTVLHFIGYIEERRNYYLHCGEDPSKLLMDPAGSKCRLMFKR